MRSVAINIQDTNNISGDKRSILVHRIFSLDSFTVSGDSEVSAKMTSSKVIKLSDIADIADITSVTVVSKCDDPNINPLFDVSVMDGIDPIFTQRCSIYSVTGIDELTKDIKLDNMQEVADKNPVIFVFITIR